MTLIHEREAVMPLYEGYFELPKAVGDVPAEALLRVAALTGERAAQLGPYASVRYHEVTASALVEAALVAGQPNVQVDERMALIDTAEEHFRAAADAEYALLERSFYHPDDQSDWRDMVLQIDFLQVYRDIICGDVTTETRQEILAILNAHARYAGVLAKDSQKRKEGRGLRNEIVLLREIWEAHRGDHDPIAFPSTVRGGSGTTRPEETHDIVIATLESGAGEWQFEPVELKTTRTRINYQHLARYISRIAFRDSGGNLRWHDKLSA